MSVMVSDPPRVGVSAPPLLEIRGLTKVYGGTAALAGVDLAVGPGEIHALLGENGAGKSTLVRILAAVDHEDGGTVAFAGAPLAGGRTPRTMADLGVAFIHQDLGLVGSMTVAENIAQYAGYRTGAAGIDWEATRAFARSALARLEVDVQPDALVAELSIAEQATVAIARALALDARLVVLDEPTASLAAGEAGRLLAILRRLRAAGVSCILVTHRLDEVLTHCDRVTVLRNGTVAGTAPVSALTQQGLVELIVGDAAPAPVVAAPAARRKTGVGPARLALKEFAGPGFGPLDLEVAAGEILAVTGFADGGHLRLLDALFGAARHDGGEARLDGAPYAPAHPTAALARGVQHVPADRNAAGLAATLTARENLFPNPPLRGWQRLDRRAERMTARRLMEDFDVRPRACEAQVSEFSGGNAQKLLVARALAVGPRMLLLSEPTAGVDVGARAVIYNKLREACAGGLAVVMASSDFEEVAEVAHRAVVLCRGAVATVLDGDDVTVATLTGASYGT